VGNANCVVTDNRSTAVELINLSTLADVSTPVINDSDHIAIRPSAGEVQKLSDKDISWPVFLPVATGRDFCMSNCMCLPYERSPVKMRLSRYFRLINIILQYPVLNL